MQFLCICVWLCVELLIYVAMRYGIYGLLEVEVRVNLRRYWWWILGGGFLGGVGGDRLGWVMLGAEW